MSTFGIYRRTNPRKNTVAETLTAQVNQDQLREIAGKLPGGELTISIEINLPPDPGTQKKILQAFEDAGILFIPIGGRTPVEINFNPKD